ncbi:unnamed protein product [Symbiodinium sp. KB8]|nr:unnamed protein product [Symbiodinium sp. KB8]
MPGRCQWHELELLPSSKGHAYFEVDTGCFRSRAVAPLRVVDPVNLKRHLAFLHPPTPLQVEVAALPRCRSSFASTSFSEEDEEEKAYWKVDCDTGKVKGFKYIEPKVVPLRGGLLGGLAIATPEEGAAPKGTESEEGDLAPKPAPLPPCLPGDNPFCGPDDDDNPLCHPPPPPPLPPVQPGQEEQGNADEPSQEGNGDESAAGAEGEGAETQEPPPAPKGLLPRMKCLPGQEIPMPKEPCQIKQGLCCHKCATRADCKLCMEWKEVLGQIPIDIDRKAWAENICPAPQNPQEADDSDLQKDYLLPEEDENGPGSAGSLGVDDL